MKKIKAILVLLVLIVGIAWIINAYIIIRAKSYIYPDCESVPLVEAVLIPGASVYRSGKLSPVLQQRVEMGIRFLFKNDSAKILFSGYAVPNGYNEPAAMAEYAKTRMVPEHRMVQDSNGTSTYTTLLNCKNRFQIYSVLIVTQEFHLPRALYIAHSLGIQAYGQIAPHNLESRKDSVREFFSRLKDFFLLKIFKLFQGRD